VSCTDEHQCLPLGVFKNAKDFVTIVESATERRLAHEHLSMLIIAERQCDIVLYTNHNYKALYVTRVAALLSPVT